MGANRIMNDDISLLLHKSEEISSTTISLTRCLILTLLSYFMDGIQWRELKTSLRISDGKLISNLNKLIELQYINKSEEKINNRTVDVYILTDNGKKELKRIIEWMELIKKVAQEGDKKCQRTLTK